MKRRRVKITGIGPVTPAGIGKEEFWRGILEPVSRVRVFPKVGKQFGPLVAAYLEDFDYRKFVEAESVTKGAARHTLFAVVGTALAMRDAGVDAAELKEGRCAVMVGCSTHDFGGIVSSMDSVSKHGVRGAKPRTVYTVNASGVCGSINDMLGVSTQSITVQSSCCSGLDAIGFAAEMIADGEVDIAICGGTEAPLHRCPLLEFRAAGLTPQTDEQPERLDRPFDRWRTTGVISEGASMFVLEPESSPRPGYSWVSGYAFSSDSPADLCSGMADAARLALAEACRRPGTVDLINAWGPGHKLVDAAEVRAMRQVFGEALDEIPCVSIKGALGTALGGAPAIQVASAVLGQKRGQVPPTVNWDYPDPECSLNLTNRARYLAHDVTLVNAHGLGGANSALILERC